MTGLALLKTPGLSPGLTNAVHVLGVLAAVVVAAFVIALALCAIAACVLSSRQSRWEERFGGGEALPDLTTEPDPIESYPSARHIAVPPMPFLVDGHSCGGFPRLVNPLTGSTAEMRIRS